MNSVDVLVLHGSPGSGKTTLSRAIAEHLRTVDMANAVIDSDDLCAGTQRVLAGSASRLRRPLPPAQRSSEDQGLPDLHARQVGRRNQPKKSSNKPAGRDGTKRWRNTDQPALLAWPDHTPSANPRSASPDDIGPRLERLNDSTYPSPFPGIHIWRVIARRHQHILAGGGDTWTIVVGGFNDPGVTVFTGSVDQRVGYSEGAAIVHTWASENSGRSTTSTPCSSAVTT